MTFQKDIDDDIDVHRNVVQDTWHIIFDQWVIKM